MKQRATLYYRLFLQQPLWFKIIIPLCLIITVVFSSSSFQEPIYNAVSKLAAAVFFVVFGYKFRRTTKLLFIFSALAALCVVLAWISL